MKKNVIISMLAAAVISTASCTREDVMFYASCYETNAIFNVSVANAAGSTKANVLINNKEGLDDNVAFGLVGAQLDNLGVFSNNGVRSAEISAAEDNIVASAYYPLVSDVDCHEDGTSIINFSESALQSGPMVSDCFEIKCNQDANVVNVQFHPIASRMSFKVCDITKDDQLANLIEIKNILLCGVATQGVYVNTDDPYWIPQYSRKPFTVFEGSNSISQSESMMSDSFHVVPGSLENGYVEVIFGVGEFTFDGQPYGASEKSIRISLSDIQPDADNIYTLALDLAEIFQTIEFSASVAEWDSITVTE